MTTIHEQEQLSRFIFSRRYFSPAKGEVKFGAFIPPKGSKDLSVHRTGTLGEEAIWKIGLTAVQSERGLKARADFLAAVAYDVGLQVIPETSTHELHANITPWPEDEIERRSLATELAFRSKLVIYQ
jgi:hypothetical protein